MRVCGASKTLGRLQGLVVDPVARKVNYLVIRTAGLFAKTRLLPITAACVDFDARSIHLLDEAVVERAVAFNAEKFAAFDDDDLLKAIFGSRPAAA
jgi:hypothetical protein